MSSAATFACVRRPGLDLLRVLAAGLVFLQHALGTSGHADWIEIHGFRIGRFGTSAFFLLAGYLAAGSSRCPRAWFRGRLAAIFPAFWVVTGIGFGSAAATGFKPFDGWQVLSQMVGMGYFTHGERMINVPTWFISPLLVLYCVVLMLRQCAASPGWWVALVVSICLACCRHDHLGTVGCHAVTFFAAAIIAQQPHRIQQQWCLAAAVLMAVLISEQNDFLYGAVSLILLAAAVGFQIRWQLAERFTGFAYEWFLVHGICLLLVARLTTSLIVMAPVGMMLSVLAAVLLKRFVRTLNQMAARAMRSERGGASGSNRLVQGNQNPNAAAVDSQRSVAVPIGCSQFQSAALTDDSAALDITADYGPDDSVAGQQISRNFSRTLESSREAAV